MGKCFPLTEVQFDSLDTQHLPPPALGRVSRSESDSWRARVPWGAERRRAGAAPRPGGCGWVQSRSAARAAKKREKLVSTAPPRPQVPFSLFLEALLYPGCDLCDSFFGERNLTESRALGRRHQGKAGWCLLEAFILGA